MEDSIKLYLQEKELLKKYQQSNPEMVTAKRNFSYAEILKRIGIEADFGFLPQGYLNLYPQDFIVEEINKTGTISSIEPEEIKPVLSDDFNDKTIYADLVKVGLSTLEAREDLAKFLGILPNQISYAGIKDKVAITSQGISIRKVDINRLKDLKIPGMFLKNFKLGKGVVEKGGLQGNQFTILIRTANTLGQGWLDSVLGGLNGRFYNFYYLQRFGSPRLLSHELGKLILQQNYEEAVRLFLTDNGAQDVPLINDIRNKALGSFGNWEKVAEIFAAMPYTFRLERQIVDYLKDKPTNYRGALQKISDQATLWVYAYASYLFNLYLSQLINSGQTLPKELPLLLNPEYLTIPLYVKKLKEDNIADPEKGFKNIFGYSALKKTNNCVTQSAVKIVKTKIINKGVIICFQLPIGAYATTFLTHLFSLYRGLPYPDWLDKTKYDIKELLGTGSVAAVEKVLGEYIFSQAEDAE